jgi:hypothetical protein
VSSLLIETAEDAIGLERGADGWLLLDADDTADSGAANGTAVDLLLRMLSERQRGSLQDITAGVDLAALGLDPGEIRLTVGRTTGESEQLILGHAPASSYTQVWARMEGEDEVFTVDDEFAVVAGRPAVRWREDTEP